MSAVIATRPGIPQRIEWARANLFNSKLNGLISAVTIGIGLLLAFLIAKFILFDANWALVSLNRRLFFVGSYPGEELYRIWISVFLGAGLASLSYGIWVGKMRSYLILLGVLAVVLLTFGLGTDLYIEEMPFTRVVESAAGTTTISGIDRTLVWEQGWAPSWLYAFSLGLALPFGGTWVIMAAVLAMLAGGALFGKHVLSRWRSSPILLQSAGAAWVLLVPAVVLLQLGVSTSQWESAFLDILIFAVGGFFSFFIGLMLALGRISPYRSVRMASVGYIEVVRAAPLLVWLLFATFLKDELGPVGEAFSGIPLVTRVMIVFAFFGGAYIAEVVRGGLQSIPRGQYEASEALALSPLQKYAFIILPQAIKAVIPAIIGRFIALWKDTALLAAISLINTLEKAKKILAGQTDIADGAFFEIYIVVGLIYWSVSYVLSRLGGAAEKRLAAGERR